MITKILPGTNIELKSGARDANLSVTGVVAMALPLSWGDQVTVINAGDNTLYSLGYKTSAAALKLVREVMNGAKQLILYRLNAAGGKAFAEISSGVTAEAIFPGTRGNDLSVVIASSGTKWLVKTYLGTQEVDSQVISTAADFSPYYVALSGTGALTAATVKLAGGSDGTTESDYTGFFTELEKREYNVICSTDSARAADVVSFVKEQNRSKSYVQGVVTGVQPNCENIYVCSSTGGVTADYELTPAESCATLAGLIAQAGVENSLTYHRGITGWTDVQPHLTPDQQIRRTQNGEMLFVPLYGSPSVLYDITSLTVVDEDHPKDFGKGLVVRTLQKYQGDLQKLLDTRCIGKIRNSVEGRAQIKAMVFEMTSQSYFAPGYIENFSADDITVAAGTERDAVNVVVGIQAVDTVDKIYVTVTAL
ncbi:phage tail sheath subtilisin-like domain-containing protein [Faecalispora anaeroviscerum]|uniref:phage tail sheath subtilisin-like domain-containing protein n=1 Tax=Faecalispora anaeroviscerum TaxID=2991836 RepID=UPI0024BA2B6A|nr:phage tail sheath subtilisin-like domain-containing protein [Faecalispora anaeroviscerum]